MANDDKHMITIPRFFISKNIAELKRTDVETRGLLDKHMYGSFTFVSTKRCLRIDVNVKRIQVVPVRFSCIQM